MKIQPIELFTTPETMVDLMVYVNAKAPAAMVMGLTWNYLAAKINEPEPEADTFKVDTANSDDTHFYVDIPGRASVCIQVTDEGVIIDLFDAHVQDYSVATCGATWDEIEEPDEEMRNA
jgi:hypothetical protein